MRQITSISASLRSPSSSVRQGIGLATATGVGACLNGLKFVILPVVLSARGLDVLSIGLLVSVTCSQVAGEAIANLVVTSRRAYAGQLVAQLFAGVMLVGAAVPSLPEALVAPDRTFGSEEVLSVRLFCLAGALMITLWRYAGIGQRAFDFWGLKAVVLVPNVAIISGALIPVRDRVLAVAVTSCAVSAVATGIAVARSHGRRTTTETDVEPGGGRTASFTPLLFLSAATYLNLLLVRILGTGLPAGSVGAIYIAMGVAQLPVMLIAGSAASTLMPRWVRASASGLPRFPGSIAMAVIAGSSAVMLVVLAGLAVGQGFARPHIDAAVFTALRTALPVLAAGVPAAAAAWLVRSYAIAVGAIWAAAAGALIGASCIPLAWMLSSSTSGLAAGYAIGNLVWAAIMVAAGRRRLVHRQR